MLAIAGNLAHYRATPQDKRDAWHYNFSKGAHAAVGPRVNVLFSLLLLCFLPAKISLSLSHPSPVSVAATVIYSYASLVPFALWLWLRYDARPSTRVSTAARADLHCFPLRPVASRSPKSGQTSLRCFPCTATRCRRTPQSLYVTPRRGLCSLSARPPQSFSRPVSRCPSAVPAAAVCLPFYQWHWPVDALVHRARFALWVPVEAAALARFAYASPHNDRTPPRPLAFVLLRNLIPYLRELQASLFLPSCGMIVLTNVALCVAFKFYFLID